MFALVEYGQKLIACVGGSDVLRRHLLEKAGSVPRTSFRTAVPRLDGCDKTSSQFIKCDLSLSVPCLDPNDFRLTSSPLRMESRRISS